MNNNVLDNICFYDVETTGIPSKGAKWDEDFEKKIQALTVEQVNAAMRKWINPEKISYIQAGDFNRKK